MQPPFPSPVPTWHNETYAAIDPSKFTGSISGKTVVISGGGAGIGREITRAFAQAGAAKIHISGRREAPLIETKNDVENTVPGVEVLVYAGVDVADEDAVTKMASKVGTWDVFVANAGYLSGKARVVDADSKDWWQSMETNVKGSFLLAKHFIPHASQSASFVALASAIVFLPAAINIGGSAYTSSKMAMIKFFEYIAAEHPELQVSIIHPGVIMTDMGQKGNNNDLPVDNILLPAHFTVWAATEDAKTANGKFVWCNWDIKELKEKLEENKEDPAYMTSLKLTSF